MIAPVPLYFRGTQLNVILSLHCWHLSMVHRTEERVGYQTKPHDGRLYIIEGSTSVNMVA